MKTGGTGKLGSTDKTKQDRIHFPLWRTKVQAHVVHPEECTVDVSTSYGRDLVLYNLAGFPCLPLRCGCLYLNLKQAHHSHMNAVDIAMRRQSLPKTSYVLDSQEWNR